MAGSPLLLLVGTLLAADATQVHIRVHAPELPAGTVLVAQTTWLGEEKRIRLTDDAQVPGDRPQDGVFEGRLSGDPVRVLALELQTETRDGEVRTLVGYNEPIEVGENELAYAVTFEGTPRVRRVASAWSSRSAETADLAMAAASIGWTGLILAYVGWLVGRRAEAP